MQSGDTFGRYLIREKIGEGGMGEVYLADDTRLNRKVALKVLAKCVADDDDRMRRFEQEARAASALNHPNILTVHEFGEEDGSAFLACELVDGETLRNLITLRELDLRSGLKIAEQTAFALDTAHAAGIIHRDIKPENIMIRKDGFVKILDFGLAKLIDRVEVESEDKTRAHFKTQAGHIVGTATYMSPEQARGLADIDARTDIWSLGILLHEMFAGRPPFTGDTVSDVIASVLKTDARPLTQLVDDCPPELDRIVTKSLRKDREERYQVIKDMALDIRSLRKQMEFSAEYGRSIGGAMLTSEHVQANTTGIVVPARSPWLLALGAVAILVAVMGGTWFAFSRYGATAQTESTTFKTAEVVSWASQPGEVYASGSFSPDGKMVAFASTRGGTKQLWVKQTSSGEAVQVTSGEFPASNPIWSPNGDELAFFSSRGDAAGFWRIPVLGGTPKLIATIDDGGARPIYWSAKNQLYLDSNNEVFALDLGDGQRRQVTDFAGKGIKARTFDISPDETQVAYATSDGNNWALWTGVPTGEGARKLCDLPGLIRNVTWHADNTHLLYSSEVDGNFHIFSIDTSGGTPRQISTSGQDALVLDIATDGSKVLLGSAKEESDIWGVEVNSGKEALLASDMSSELWPDVSPDGRKLIYQSIKNLSQGNRITTGAIVAKGTESNDQPHELTSNGYLPRWSPDGKTVAFVRLTGTTRQIESVNTMNGEVKKITTGGISSFSYSILPYNRFQAADYSWAPDGSKIAYISNKSGQSNFWLVDSTGTNDVQLTDNADPDRILYCPLWASDGKRIALTTKTDDGKAAAKLSVALVDIDTKKILPLADANSFIRLVGWSERDDRLILASLERRSAGEGSPDNVVLLSADIKTGNLREITVLEDAYPTNIHISPDRKTLAFVARRDGKDNLWTKPLKGGEARRVTNNNDSRLYFSSLSWSLDGNTIFFGKQSRYSILSMLTNFQ